MQYEFALNLRFPENTVYYLTNSTDETGKILTRLTQMMKRSYFLKFLIVLAILPGVLVPALADEEVNQSDSAQSGVRTDSVGQSETSRGVISRILESFRKRREERHAQAEKYYALARNYYDLRQYSQALEALDKTVKLNDSFADAYVLKARMLLQSEDWYDWMLAEQAAKEALRVDWNNPDSHLLLAAIYEKQCSHHNAADQYKRALKIDSTNIEAFYRLGLHYRDQMYAYGSMISVESPYLLFDENMMRYFGAYNASRNPGAYGLGLYDAQSTSPVGLNITGAAVTYDRILEDQFSQVGMIRFDRFGENLYEKAEHAFQNALQTDSTHWPSLLELGLLAYQQDSTALLQKRLDHVLRRAPKNKQTMLFAGLASYALQAYEQSEKLFAEAFTFMQSGEQFIYESPQYLLPVAGPEVQESEEAEGLAAAVDHRAYWRSRDPLFLSPENERRVAHYARCAYAHFRFSFPPRDIEGLQTDRGKVYVRYGEPLEIKRKRPEAAGHYYEFWYYKDKTFCFDDPWGDGRTGYDLGAYYGIDFNEIARQEFRNNPEDYRLPTEGELWYIPCQLATFRGENKATDLEILYGIPVKPADLRPTDNGYQGTYTRGLFLFDDEFNDIHQQIENREYTRSVLPDTSETDQIADRTSVSLNPGEYLFSLELKNHYSQNISMVRNELTIPSYRGDSLMISDIILASDIRANRYPVDSRDSMRITPNPAFAFEPGQMLHLYYEVYNLSSASERRSTRFAVTTEISTAERSQGGLRRVWNGMRRLLGLQPGERSVSLHQEYQGNAESERQRSVVDISEWEPGLYTLAVTVRDLHSGQQVEKGIQFRILQQVK